MNVKQIFQAIKEEYKRIYNERKARIESFAERYPEAFTEQPHQTIKLEVLKEIRQNREMDILEYIDLHSFINEQEERFKVVVSSDRYMGQIKI